MRAEAWVRENFLERSNNPELDPRCLWGRESFRAGPAQREGRGAPPRPRRPGWGERGGGGGWAVQPVL